MIKSMFYKIKSALCSIALLIFISACGGEKLNVKPIELTFDTSSLSSPTGTRISLSWSSINAEKCTASGDWSGNKGITGIEEVILTKETNNYILTCSAPAGNSVTKNIQVEGYRMISGSVSSSWDNLIYRIYYDENRNFKYDSGEYFVESLLDGSFSIRFKSGLISAEILNKNAQNTNLINNFLVIAELNNFQDYIYLSSLSSLGIEEFLSDQLNYVLGISQSLDIDTFNIDNSESINSEYKKVWILERQISTILLSILKITEENSQIDNSFDIYQIISKVFLSNQNVNDVSSFLVIKNIMNEAYLYFSLLQLEDNILRNIATSITALTRVYETNLLNDSFHIFHNFIFDIFLTDLTNFIKKNNDSSMISSSYQANLVDYIYTSQGLESPIDQAFLRKNISIPIQDISNTNFIIVDKEQDQYLGHPSSIMLGDNRTILVVYPKGHGAGEIVYKKSYDAGLSWTSRLETPESWNSSKEVPIIYRMTDDKDIERLVLFSSLYPIRSSISEDEGITWSELEPIGNFGGIVAMASIIKRQDGSYIGFFQDDGRFIDGAGAGEDAPDYDSDDSYFTLYSSTSNDGGLTWNAPSEIYKNNEIYLCEPGAILSPDGNQIALLLRENKRVKNPHIIFSDDGGISWSLPRELPAALTGDRHIAKYINANQILISYRDRSIDRIYGGDNDYYGDWVSWVGSFDDLRYGFEGYKKIRIMDNKHPNDAAYTGIEILEDGSILGISYGYWTKNEQPFIVAKNIHID